MGVQRHDRAHEEDEAERADELGDVGGRAALGRLGELGERAAPRSGDTVVDARLLDAVARLVVVRSLVVVLAFQVLVGHAGAPYVRLRRGSLTTRSVGSPAAPW